jgi:hypothetical protein
MDDLTNRSPKKPTPTITAEEIARRREFVRQAHANNRIEGIEHDPATDPIFDAYVRGEIEATEMIPRLKAQLGLP